VDIYPGCLGLWWTRCSLTKIKDITLGVPRIKEIINASKNISTPIITAKLVCENDVKAAQIVKGRIEKTTLGEVARSIKTVLRASQAVISVRLDSKRIEALQLDISSYTVADAILRTPKIKLKQMVCLHYMHLFLHQ
jgi:DNA-directed RNA polymerase III subunit RPC1